MRNGTGNVPDRRRSDDALSCRETMAHRANITHKTVVFRLTNVFAVAAAASASLKMRNCRRELFKPARAAAGTETRRGRPRPAGSRSVVRPTPGPRARGACTRHARVRLVFQFYQLHRAVGDDCTVGDSIWRPIAGRRKHNKWRGRRRPAPG